MHLELPALPYAKDALEPHLSARTLDFHYEKHHRGYITKLKQAVEGTPAAQQGLTELIETAAGDVFNHAAQVWNHTFYWRSMTPGRTQPGGELKRAIERDFGSLADLKHLLAEVAAGEFGSGWAWLVKNRGDHLAVLSTHDADNPLRHGQTPLLTIDVWEHAYYLDYQNDRARYLEGVIDHLLNWEFAEHNLQETVRAVAEAHA